MKRMILFLILMIIVIGVSGLTPNENGNYQFDAKLDNPLSITFEGDYSKTFKGNEEIEFTSNTGNSQFKEKFYITRGDWDSNKVQLWMYGGASDKIVLKQPDYLALEDDQSSRKFKLGENDIAVYVIELDNSEVKIEIDINEGSESYPNIRIRDNSMDEVGDYYEKPIYIYADIDGEEVSLMFFTKEMTIEDIFADQLHSKQVDFRGELTDGQVTIKAEDEGNNILSISEIKIEIPDDDNQEYIEYISNEIIYEDEDAQECTNDEGFIYNSNQNKCILGSVNRCNDQSTQVYALAEEQLCNDQNKVSETEEEPVEIEQTSEQCGIEQEQCGIVDVYTYRPEPVNECFFGPFNTCNNPDTKTYAATEKQLCINENVIPEEEPEVCAENGYVLYEGTCQWKNSGEDICAKTSYPNQEACQKANCIFEHTGFSQKSATECEQVTEIGCAESQLFYTKYECEQALPKVQTFKAEIEEENKGNETALHERSYGELVDGIIEKLPGESRKEQFYWFVGIVAVLAILILKR